MLTKKINLSFIGPLLLLAACGGSEDPVPQVRTSTLVQANDCPTLLVMMQEDASVKMNDSIDQQIAYLDQGGFYGSNGVGAEDGGNTSTGTGAPNNNGGDPTLSAGEEQGPDHSETNTQVEGVDEADIVKTDGNYI